ncbi:zinc metallochaperone AztD [Actinomadura rugatobispora]|uniref:Zinc metallochaperone AztD n=1 Tax=Actinomadura rugatobispora TaxID=1994 RepID=A0ABW1AGN1_9ACTN|nr:zinc metallochaperone AztD [Actinomadura rugatobispora]
MNKVKSLRPRTKAVLPGAMVAVALALSACGQDDPGNRPAARSEAPAPAAVKVKEPLVVTYDGGLHILDAATLKVVQSIPLPGFIRVNPAGNGRHVMVSTSTGFRVLDAAGATLTKDEFAAPKPGHVVHHAGKTVLFSDGAGKATIFDPRRLGDGLPQSTTHTAPHPHHGVAIALANGELVITLGDEEKRPGIQVLGADRREVARSEDCPGVHGEATAKDETVVIGCETGALLYRDGKITKVRAPDAYGRVGNQAGHEDSPIVLGDYKTDPDAELERPERVSLIDTRSGSLKLVDLGTSYTFRSLGRGPHGEALVLGTDGALHVIDPERGEVTRKIKVMDQWREPLEWQQPRPALHVRDHTAYVTDPAGKKLHAVDIDSGKVTLTAQLPQSPNEITGT